MSERLSLSEMLGSAGMEALDVHVRKHRDDPTLGCWIPPSSSFIENTLPDGDAKKQWLELAKIGVFPVTVEPTKLGTHVSYAVPPDAGFK